MRWFIELNGFNLHIIYKYISFRSIYNKTVVKLYV